MLVQFSLIMSWFLLHWWCVGAFCSNSVLIPFTLMIWPFLPCWCLLLWYVGPFYPDGEGPFCLDGSVTWSLLSWSYACSFCPDRLCPFCTDSELVPFVLVTWPPLSWCWVGPFYIESVGPFCFDSVLIPFALMVSWSLLPW